MPHFLLCFTLAGIGLLSTAPVAALSVYKYVDDAGRVTYSESAPAKSTRLRIVNIDPDANALTFERPRAVGAPGSGASGGANNDDVIARLAQELAQRVANMTASGAQPSSGFGISRNQLSARDRFLIQQVQTNANATGPTSQNTGNTSGTSTAGVNTTGATDAGGTGMGGGAGTGGVITGTTGNNNGNATVNPPGATGTTPNSGTPSQNASPQNPIPSSGTTSGAITSSNTGGTTTGNASGTTTLNSNSPTFGSAGTGTATFSNSDSTFTSGSPTFTSNSPTFGPGASMGSVDLSGGNNLGGGIATGSNLGNASGSGTVNPGTVSPFGGNSGTATTTGTGGTGSTGSSSSDGFSNTSGFSDTTGFSDTSGFSDTTGFGAPSGGGTTASDRGGAPKGGSGATRR